MKFGRVLESGEPSRTEKNELGLLFPKRSSWESSILSLIRDRWHPLRKLRQIEAFRWFQKRFDFAIYKQLPGTHARIAMKLLRDASWLAIAMEPKVQSAFELVLRFNKPRVFWDVGANLGFYSWVVRQYPSIQQVILFEPDPTNFNLITKTIRKNKISNCRPMNLALSNTTGKALFLVDRASGSTGSLQSVSNAENPLSLQREYQMTETISSRTTTVDDLINQGLPAPQLLKIDVEGAEHLVLAGAERCLRQIQPVLILETSSWELLRGLNDFDYSVYRIDAGNFLCISNRSGVDLAQVAQAFGPPI